MRKDKLGFYDFFSGGGMANIGLGPDWRCLMANDFDAKKAAAYRANFPPGDELIEKDVFELTTSDLPEGAHLAWASFPCQDLSLAGKGKGLQGRRSGSFWGFWRLMTQLIHEDRPVPLIVLENVTGAISANKGEDFKILMDALFSAGYVAGPLVMNAHHFIPQSRPRLFIVAVLAEFGVPSELTQEMPHPLWHPKILRRAYLRFPQRMRRSWIWWRLPAPEPRTIQLIDIIEEAPTGVQWHTREQTQRLLELMDENNLTKVRWAQSQGERVVGTIYKRIRKDKTTGQRVQRAELRLDGVSGCLRTARGGSSRQILMIIEGERIRSRLLSPREGARLMGLPDSY
ncbi:MAG TPA: DNA cytosine methyltransferase, partial [Caldilineae bacterium]|nr:DNA cytosine methyltransferase [Caldilineae bacterium]